MAEIDRVITGIPAWLMQRYVESAGGVERDGRLVGDGWTVTLSAAPDHVVGSLRVGQVRLRIDGTDDGVAAAWDALEPKLLRAGG